MLLASARQGFCPDAPWGRRSRHPSSQDRPSPTQPMTPSDCATPRPAPFFILGCVRSGTTMLRNILRKHPNLACPEETHFFRWSEPFRGPTSRTVMLNNATLKRHRHLDGITDEEFLAMLDSSNSRSELITQYMARYIALKKPQAKRWFEKTPQNFYGANLIAAEFPQAKFIHIVRDPINVVASLRIGKVMKVDDLVGACSYWNEAAAVFHTLNRAWPERVLELNYEAFTAAPLKGIQKILEFVGEPYVPAHFAQVNTTAVSHEESGVLSDEDMTRVRQLCLVGRQRYGYAAANETLSPAPELA